MNTNTAVIFVLAVIFKVERLRFWSIHGQAKIWGVVISAVGSTVMVMWTGPALLPLLTTSKASHDKTIGATMLSLAVLSGASWNLLMVSEADLWFGESTPLRNREILIHPIHIC